MMRGPKVRVRALLVLVLAGCGPSKGSETDSETGEATTSTATGASAGTTTAPTTGAATGEASTTGTTAAETTAEGTTVCVDCPGQPDLPPAPEDCNPWTQDCPEGQKCTLDGGFQDAHCVVVMPGGKDVGEPCTVVGDPWSGVDDCGFGLACYPADPALGPGTCVPICTEAGGPDGCADPARFCTPLCQSCLIGVCLDACDPLADECPEGQICVGSGFPDGFQCLVDASGGGKQHGDPCQFVNDCGAGLLCGPPGIVPGCAAQDGCCVQYCDLGQPACPDGDQGVECVALYMEGEAPAGVEHVGVCVLPQ